MNIGRRAVLRGLAAAPLAGAAIAQKMAAAGIGMSAAPMQTLEEQTLLISEAKGPAFRTFEDWMQKFGVQVIDQESKYVSTLDPDLTGLHLPLPTLIRMQRRRQYERALKSRRAWFSNLLKTKSVVHW